MERIWAPWRMEYIGSAGGNDCIFCAGAAIDRERLVLHTTAAVGVMLNRYPYSNGHLLVYPRRHVADLRELAPAERGELLETVARCQEILAQGVRAQGFNIGMNVGEVAGAGIADHLHLHVVPRWGGDANFMTVLAEVRVIPEHLLATYDKLFPLFATAVG